MLTCGTRAKRKQVEEVPDSFWHSSHNGSKDLDIWKAMLMSFRQPTDEQDTFFTLTQFFFSNAANMTPVVAPFYCRLAGRIIIAFIQAQILLNDSGSIGLRRKAGTDQSMYPQR